MLLHKQKTLSREATVSGPGLFTGEEVTVKFEPSEENTGITFIREYEGKVATRTLTLRLPAVPHDQLREMAFVSRRSQHELIMEALNDLFVKYGKPPTAPPQTAGQAQLMSGFIQVRVLA